MLSANQMILYDVHIIQGSSKELFWKKGEVTFVKAMIVKLSPQIKW